jgi:hypothetical protein
VLECAADKVIKLKDKSQRKQNPKNQNQNQNQNQNLNPQTTPAPSTIQQAQPSTTPTQPSIMQQTPKPSQASPSSTKTRQHIPIAIQRKVFKRDQCCQYLNKTTGKKCESKWNLHIDHVQPFWADGSNELENLRILCAGPLLSGLNHKYCIEKGPLLREKRCSTKSKIYPRKKAPNVTTYSFFPNHQAHSTFRV